MPSSNVRICLRNKCGRSVLRGSGSPRLAGERVLFSTGSWRTVRESRSQRKIYFSPSSFIVSFHSDYFRRALRIESRLKVEKEIRAFARFPNKFLSCISRCIFIYLLTFRTDVTTRYESSIFSLSHCSEKVFNVSSQIILSDNIIHDKNNTNIIPGKI